MNAAEQCVKTLALKFKAALDELHLFGFLHNDVRLPNFCFDSSFNAILVDLDRCTPLSVRYFQYNSPYPSSCMYKSDLSGKKLDFCPAGMVVGLVTRSQ